MSMQTQIYETSQQNKTNADASLFVSKYPSSKRDSLQVPKDMMDTSLNTDRCNKSDFGSRENSVMSESSFEFHSSPEFQSMDVTPEMQSIVPPTDRFFEEEFGMNRRPSYQQASPVPSLGMGFSFGQAIEDEDDLDVFVNEMSDAEVAFLCRGLCGDSDEDISALAKSISNSTMGQLPDSSPALSKTKSAPSMKGHKSANWATLYKMEMADSSKSATTSPLRKAVSLNPKKSVMMGMCIPARPACMNGTCPCNKPLNLGKAHTTPVRNLKLTPKKESSVTATDDCLISDISLGDCEVENCVSENDLKNWASLYQEELKEGEKQVIIPDHDLLKDDDSEMNADWKKLYHEELKMYTSDGKFPMKGASDSTEKKKSSKKPNKPVWVTESKSMPVMKKNSKMNIKLTTPRKPVKSSSTKTKKSSKSRPNFSSGKKAKSVGVSSRFARPGQTPPGDNKIPKQEPRFGLSKSERMTGGRFMRATKIVA